VKVQTSKSEEKNTNETVKKAKKNRLFQVGFYYFRITTWLVGKILVTTAATRTTTATRTSAATRATTATETTTATATRTWFLWFCFRDIHNSSSKFSSV
jgi:hypothetical protein